MAITLKPLRHALVLTALVLLALSVTGCAGGAAWGATLAALMSLSMLFAAGCGQSHTTDDGGGRADAGADARVPTVDGGGGYWERCCVEGEIDSCYCAGGGSCNYGWFTECSDGSCAYNPDMCPGDIDAGAPDAGGDWEPCCVDGVIDSCFCPADAECNYGWFTDCGAGTCAFGPDECPDLDAGVPDAGPAGTWEPCCNAGVIESCFCPAGLACNYGWFTDCGDGTCSDPGSMCPAP